ncbi:MAG: Asd/ArgC dimerization domain-containing protein [Myxococcota bacterium]
MADDHYSIGLWGATGALGREVRIALEGEGLSIERLVPVVGTRTVGESVSFLGRPVDAVAAAAVDLGSLDAAIFATPSDAAEQWRQPLIDAGVLVIDASPAADRNEGLPLVWPSLDLSALDSHPGGFGVPGGVASTAAPVLAALAKAGRIVAVDAHVLLGAGSAGREGQESLSRQTLGLLGHRVPEAGPFGAVLAFNLVAGSARAGDRRDPVDQEAASALRRLVPSLAAVEPRVSVVQVPIFTGVGVSLTVRFADPTPERPALLAALDGAPELLRVEGRIAARDAVELDEVMVGDLRFDDDGAFRCFVTADPLHRTGQAIATLLTKVIAEDLW